MSKGLTSAQTDARGRTHARVKLAVYISTYKAVGSTDYMVVCTGEEPISITPYSIPMLATPGVIKVERVAVAGVATADARVSIEDDGSFCQSIYATEIVGAAGMIFMAIEDENGEYSTPVKLFDGHVSTVNIIDGVSVSLQLTTNVSLKWRPALHEATATCQNVFTGRLCQWVGGATTCDRTWATCTSLSNTANFRGFRYAPKAGDTLNLSTPIAVQDSFKLDPPDPPYRGSPTHRALPRLPKPPPQGPPRRIPG